MFTDHLLLFSYLFQIDNSQYDGPNPDEDDDSEMDSDSEDEESDREGQNRDPLTDEEPLGSDDDINEGSDGEIFETGYNYVMICLQVDFQGNTKHFR